MFQNKLKLNCDKTKYMMIFNRNYKVCNNIRLEIREHEIERVDKMKYLGIIIDRKLKWDDHVDYTASNIARKIGFIYRSCKYVSKWHKLTIYRSIIETYFVYCPTILFTLNNAQIRTFQIQQNKIMRIIVNKGYDTPLAEMIGSLDWLNVKQLITYHIFKIY